MAEGRPNRSNPAFDETASDMCYHPLLGSFGEPDPKMECKGCKSRSLRKFEGELTVSIADLKGLKASPVYIRQTVLVCLHCGLAELFVPATDLQSIKRGMAEFLR